MLNYTTFIIKPTPPAPTGWAVFTDYMANKNLLIWLRFNETEGPTAEDSSGNENHGALEGSYNRDENSLLSAGTGKAVRLNATGKVNLGHVSDLSNIGTTGYTMKSGDLFDAAMDASTELTVFLNMHDGTNGIKFYYETGNFKVIHGTETAVFSVTLNTTKHRILVIYNATTKKVSLFIDGNQVGSSHSFSNAIVMPPASSACTFNPSDKSPDITLSNDNMTAATSSPDWGSVRGTLGFPVTETPREYEVVIDTAGYVGVGFGNAAALLGTYGGNSPYSVTAINHGYGAYYYTSSIYVGGNTFTTGDVITACIYIEDNRYKIDYKKNGNFLRQLDTNLQPNIITDDFYPMISMNVAGACTLRTIPSAISYPTEGANHYASTTSYTIESGGGRIIDEFSIEAGPASAEDIAKDASYFI